MGDPLGESEAREHEGVNAVREQVREREGGNAVSEQVRERSEREGSTAGVTGTFQGQRCQPFTYDSPGTLYFQV